MHLISSLLKIKDVAASSSLPPELRTAISKPQLPDEEAAALHNVTSSLYNREPVRHVVDRAVAAVCQVLGVAVPVKRVRKGAGAEEQPEQPPGRAAAAAAQTDDADETDFEGFESDADQRGAAVGEPEEPGAPDGDEAALSRYDGLLGGSSDSEQEFDMQKFAQFRGRETVNLDDISLSGSASEADSEEGEDSRWPSPPPKKKQKEAKKASAATKAGPTTESTFLPSLMGGYVSGSESASDIEDAKPKKRRGQRARQAIWEKKYGARANHLQKQQSQGGRDAGWDMRRGAVDGEAQGRQTPWKKPLAASSRGAGPRGRTDVAKAQPKPLKRDDEGPLHPSWAAKKAAQQSQKAVAFAGQKVVFD